jgi:succinyl-diaminopimelate desuccinylase
MSSDSYQRVAARIDGYTDLMIDLQRRLTAIPALDPESGGEGEGKKAAAILEMLEGMGVEEVEVLNSPDARVPDGHRPNIVARVPGKDRSRTVWLMAHMDVVPAGKLDDWDSDPWEVRVEGDRIYGRGVEDNQQGLVAALLLASALHDEGVQPERDLGLLFVADEETGNKLGIEYVLDNHEIFKPDDIIVVPDGGEPDGSMIEVAEKGIVWIKCTVKGRSTHGSTPDRGVNAHLAAARLIVELDRELHARFDRRNDVFDPPISTFAVTKVDPGVPNVNTVPGEHTFYLDCRVMPDYNLSQVLEAAKEVAGRIDSEHGTTTSATAIQRMDAAPPTPNDAPVVDALKRAVEQVYDVEARPMGIGGGTVAACIRRKGYHAAVWARMDETMHGPNEYCIIPNLIGDAKVFAHLLLI